tara:strand:+ start:519 stop:1199 length:681 start_codon:yes stop_codon:yes gene_type:complete
MAFEGYPKSFDHPRLYHLTLNGEQSEVYGHKTNAEKGRNLIANGHFTDNTNQWTAGLGWAWNSAEGGRVKGNNTSATFVDTSITPVVGTTYLLTLDAVYLNGSTAVSLGGVSDVIGGSGSFVQYFTATNTNKLTFTGSSASIYLDNIEVREVTLTPGNFMLIKAMGDNDQAYIEYKVKLPNSSNPSTVHTIRCTVGTTINGPFSYVKHNGETATGDAYSLVYEVED